MTVPPPRDMPRAAARGRSRATRTGHIRWAAVWQAVLAALLLPLCARSQDAGAQIGPAMQAAAEAHQARRYPEAEAAWLRAADICDQAGNQKGKAFAWLMAGTAQAHQGKHEQALQRLGQALAAFVDLGMEEEQATCHLNLGVSQAALGRHDRAIDSYQAALELYTALGLREEQAECLANIAISHQGADRYQEAVEMHRGAVELYVELGLRKQQAWALQGLATAYRALTRYDEAAECYETALAIYTDLDDAAQQAACLADLGVVETDRNRYTAAEQHLRRALAWYRQAEDEARIARCHRDLGVVEHHTGRYDQAVESYNSAARVFSQLGLERDLALCWQNLGVSQGSLGQYEAAVETLRRALALADRLQLPIVVADCALNLAGAFTELGQHSAAIAHYQAALGIYTERGRLRQQADCWQSIGMLYAIADNPSKAVEYRERALEVYARLGLEREQAGCWLDLGVAYRRLGEVDRAIDYAGRALEVYRRLGLRREQAGCLLNLGNACLSAERTDESLEHLHRAEELLLDLSRTVAAPGQGWVPEELYQVEAALGETLRHRGAEGDLESAYVHQARAVEIVEHLRGRGASTVDMRTSYFSKMTWVYDRIIDLLLDMSRQGLEPNPEALGEQDPSLWTGLSMPVPDLWPGWRSFDEAALHYNESTRARVLQEMLANREILFSDPATQELYARWTSLVARSRSLSRSFTAAYEAEDHELAQRLAAQLAQITRERGEVERELFQTSYGRVVQAETVPLESLRQLLEPDEALVEYRLLGDRVAALLVTRAGLRVYETPVSPGGDRPIWGSGEQMIGAQVLDHLHSLQEQVARRANLPPGFPGVVEPEELLSQFGVSELCWLFRRPMVLSASALEDDRFEAQEAGPQQLRIAAALYRLLLAPLEHRLVEEGIAGLIVVPDGALCYLPFAALVEHLPADVDEAPGGFCHAAPGVSYAVDRWRISYLPSVSMYAGMAGLATRRPEATHRICVFADPIFTPDDPRLGAALGVQAQNAPGERLTRLPNSRREAERVLAAFGGTPADLFEDPAQVDWGAGVGLLSRAAAEPAVHDPRLADYGYLALSTHGIIRPDVPDFSYIALSCPEAAGIPEQEADAPRDGRLMLPESFGLSLNANMVTLSACRTAEGDFRSGEGILGLTAAMFVSGARAVTASVWSVSDQATATLIGRYHELLATGTPPADALRQTQLEMLNRARQACLTEPPSEDAAEAGPYYWAPFVLQGTWR